MHGSAPGLGWLYGGMLPYANVVCQRASAHPILQLQAGDANQDVKFDQLELVMVQVAAKYLTGQLATWGQGDSDGAPGGRPGNPAAGNGVFDQMDVVAALAPGHYLTGAYVAVHPHGQVADGHIGGATTPGPGSSSSLPAPADTELTSIKIDSAAGIFTGEAAQHLGGSCDHDADNNIFKATFGSSFSSLSFGNVAQSGLSRDFVINNLTVVGSLAGGGALGEVDLVDVPEPSAWLLVMCGTLSAAPLACRRRRESHRRQEFMLMGDDGLEPPTSAL